MDGDSFLIKLVKNRPILWEKDSRRNEVAQKKAWSEVAVKTGAECDWIKARWNTLQERFSAAFRENSEIKRQQQFKYFNEMLFLTNQIKLQRTNRQKELTQTKPEFVITRKEIDEYCDYSDNEHIFIEITDGKDEEISANRKRIDTVISEFIEDHVCDSTAPDSESKLNAERNSKISCPEYSPVEHNQEPSNKKPKMENFLITEFKKENDSDLISTSSSYNPGPGQSELSESRTIEKNDRCEDTIFGELVSAMLKGMAESKKKQVKKEIMNVLLS